MTAWVMRFGVGRLEWSDDPNVFALTPDGMRRQNAESLGSSLAIGYRMANGGQCGRAVRFGLEAGAIFLGVTLGFLADDYRDYLNDRSLETESLHQVMEDLRLDREDMTPMRHKREPSEGPERGGGR